jgi:hypothetical protein
VWVGIEFYNTRLYPWGCKYGETSGNMVLRDLNTQYTSTWIGDWSGMNAYHATLDAGTYYIDINNIDWSSIDVQDYSIRVVSKD